MQKINDKDRGQILRMAGNIASGMFEDLDDVVRCRGRIADVSVKLAIEILFSVDKEIEINKKTANLIEAEGEAVPERKLTRFDQTGIYVGVNTKGEKSTCCVTELRCGRARHVSRPDPTNQKHFRESRSKIKTHEFIGESGTWEDIEYFEFDGFRFYAEKTKEGKVMSEIEKSRKIAEGVRNIRAMEYPEVDAAICPFCRETCEFNPDFVSLEEGAYATYEAAHNELSRSVMNEIEHLPDCTWLLAKGLCGYAP